MIANSSPRSTSKLTPSMARVPPNRSSRSATSSTLAPGARSTLVPVSASDRVRIMATEGSLCSTDGGWGPAHLRALHDEGSGQPPLAPLVVLDVPEGRRALLRQPEVERANVLVVAQDRRRLVHHDLAGLEDVAVLGDRQRHVRVLLDEQHRGALLVDLDDQVADLLDDQRGETEARLVEQQQL